MMQKTLSETINERVAAIEVVVNLISSERREADLRDLRVLLINMMGLLKRDPGIEMAADDLYAAAGALVRSASQEPQPSAKGLRLLRDARDRFCGRFPNVAERVGPEENMRLKGLEAAYAVQLIRDTHIMHDPSSFGSMAA